MKELKKTCDKNIVSDIPNDEEKFRFACYVGSWRRYAYYMGQFNHLLVLEKNEVDFIINKEITFEDIKKQFNYDILELFNGYIKTKISSKFEIEYSTDTDIYKYVEMAGWLTETDYKNARLLRADEYDRIEIHHLNGDSTDNSVNNLIYIPNTIHCIIHSK